MPAKKLSARASAWLGVITMLIVFAAVGVLSEQFLHSRLDLTRDRRFTLSRVASKVLKGLHDQIIIKAVISSDLPGQFVQIRTQVTDLLDEFQARSDGKLRVIYEDPGEDALKRQEATSLGIQEVQLQEESGGGMQIRKGFFGLAVIYGEKKEVFPVLQDPETLEYELIVKLMKLTGTFKSVGIVEGTLGNQFTLKTLDPEPRTSAGFDENFSVLKQEIQKLFFIQKPVLAPAPIASSIDVLLVTAPVRLGEREKFRIDQYLMKGRPVIFLTPGLDVDISGLRGKAADNGYTDLLAHYGLGVHANVILEKQYCRQVHFSNSSFPTLYPYWINVNYNGLSASSPITSRLQAISLPWTSSVYFDTTVKDSSETQVLVRSSPQSWEETGGFFFSPRNPEEYVPTHPGSFPIAVLKTGRFTSFYASHPLPSDSAGTIDTTQVLKTSTGRSSILLISNALFATDFYMGYDNATSNLHLILNALDQLVLDPDLISVRSRTLEDQPIDESRKATARLPVTIMNMLLAPILLLIAGVLNGIRRRNKEAGT